MRELVSVIVWISDTPKQYFEDNPWLKDSCLFVQSNRVFKQTNHKLLLRESLMA